MLVVNPGSVTILLGKETHTSKDEFTFKARRLVPLKALNETQYRYTSIPGALRGFSGDGDKQCEISEQPRCSKEDSNLQPLLKVKAEPLAEDKVEPLLKQPNEPLLKQPVQPMLKEFKQIPVQISTKNTPLPKAQTKILSKKTEPKGPSPKHKEKVETQPLNWESMLKDGSAQALLKEYTSRSSVVSRNGQYRRFDNRCQASPGLYERLVSDLANQNQVLLLYYLPRQRSRS